MQQRLPRAYPTLPGPGWHHCMTRGYIYTTLNPSQGMHWCGSPGFPLQHPDQVQTLPAAQHGPDRQNSGCDGCDLHTARVSAPSCDSSPHPFMLSSQGWSPTALLRLSHELEFCRSGCSGCGWRRMPHTLQRRQNACRWLRWGSHREVWLDAVLTCLGTRAGLVRSQVLELPVHLQPRDLGAIVQLHGLCGTCKLQTSETCHLGDLTTVQLCALPWYEQPTAISCCRDSLSCTPLACSRHPSVAAAETAGSDLQGSLAGQNPNLPELVQKGVGSRVQA